MSTVLMVCPFCDEQMSLSQFEEHNCFGEEPEPRFFDLGGG
jgi:hypothetical protein